MDEPDDVAAVPAGPPQAKKGSNNTARRRRGRPRNARGRRRSRGSARSAVRKRTERAVRESTSRRAVSSHLSPFYMAHRAKMMDRIASRRQVRYEENKEEENARNRIRYLSHKDDMLEYQRQ